MSKKFENTNAHLARALGIVVPKGMVPLSGDGLLDLCVAAYWQRREQVVALAERST